MDVVRGTEVGDALVRCGELEGEGEGDVTGEWLRRVVMVAGEERKAWGKSDHSQAGAHVTLAASEEEGEIMENGAAAGSGRLGGSVVFMHKEAGGRPGVGMRCLV